MKESIARALAVLARGAVSRARPLSGFVDSLLQTFENCRPGLSEDLLGSHGEAAEEFFTALYEKETARLRDTVRREESLLSAGAREAYVRKVDDLVRGVLIPAYVRLARRFTPRERNGFYVVPEPWHSFERLAWAAGGVGLGVLVVAAPFIPLWSKEWVLPFLVGGLVFPNIRRWLAVRQYESEVNRLVLRADDEISRIDTDVLETNRLPETGRSAAATAPPRRVDVSSTAQGGS